MINQMWHSSREPSLLWVLFPHYSLYFPCVYISAGTPGDCYPVTFPEEKEAPEETTLPINKEGRVCDFVFQ